MTEQNRPPTDSQLELPGLEQRPTDSAMLTAAKVTIGQLRDLELVQPRHAVLEQLVLSLADAIDRGARAGRASAVAMAAAQLRETMLVLDPPPDEGDAPTAALDALRAFMDRLERAAANGQVDA